MESLTRRHLTGTCPCAVTLALTPVTATLKLVAVALTLALSFAAPASALTNPPTIDWVERYGGLGNGNNQVTDMAVDAQGCTYVTGYSSGSWWDMATVKYSPSGRQLHAVRYNGPSGGDDVPYGIAIDTRGDVYVAGYTDGNGQFNYDFVTIQYDSTLVQHWVRTYTGQFNLGLDEAYDIVADAGGDAYVTGFSLEGNTGNDYVTVKYDAAGTRLWVQRYNGIANSDDGANAIALDPDGSVVVTGSSQRSSAGGNYDIATVKYSVAGSLLWSRTVNGSSNTNDGGLDLAIDEAHEIYVGGYTTGIGTLSDMTVMKYAPDGTLLWQRTYDRSAGHDAVLALTLDAAGTHVIVTGFASTAVTHADYATLDYDSAGALQWARTYDGPVAGYDEGQSVAVDVHGNVFITGYSDGGTDLVNYDYATLEYDAAGTEQWEMRYDGTGDNIDVAARVAVDPHGDLIVGGWSTGTNGGLVDFTTIKYGQSPAAEVEGPDGTGGPGHPDVAGNTGTSAAGLWVLASPNPFHGATTLRFHLPSSGPVDLGVWDAAGRRVGTLARGWLEAGEHLTKLEGASLAPGLYLYRLEAGKQHAQGKLVRR